MGSNKKNPPRRMPKTKSAAPLAPTKHTVPCDNFGVRRGGGVPPPPFGVGSQPGSAPVPLRLEIRRNDPVCVFLAIPAGIVAEPADQPFTRLLLPARLVVSYRIHRMHSVFRTPRGC